MVESHLFGPGVNNLVYVIHDGHFEIIRDVVSWFRFYERLKDSG
jgi:hypothetical protein